MDTTIQYLNYEWTNTNILSASALIDTSLNQRSLDVDTMTVRIKSENDLTSFQQNTPVRIFRGGSQYALWFLSGVSKVSSDIYELYLISSLGRVSQLSHKGGIYGSSNTDTMKRVTSGDLIREICGYKNGLPTAVTVYVSPVFESTILYGFLPYVSPSGENGAQTGSAKDNLLQVLFALNATVRDDADGVLRIENLPTRIQSNIGSNRVYMNNGKVEYNHSVTSLTLLEHQYIAGSQITTLFEGTTTEGQPIIFSQPMGNLSASGFSIIESGANYAIVGAGNGTLTGTPYIHTTREITKPVSVAEVPNTVRVESATMVSVTNSSDVSDRLVDYYKHRTYINVDATIDFEDAGDVVNIYDPFDKENKQACIEKISPLVVSQTMKGNISALVGFTPWQVVPFEDVRELLTGSGTWTVPAGVTQVTAVLIGGGSGGAAGADGTAGKSVTGSVTLPDSNNFTWSFSSTSGGAGGAGGAGGVGGRILRASLMVTAGQSFPFSAGAGGAAGADGGSSSFGGMTSQSGSSAESGYTDPVTGETFGAQGDDGVAGGAGGAGGAATSLQASDGAAGGAAGSHSGGAGGASRYETTDWSDFRQTISHGGSGGGGASGDADGTAGAALSFVVTSEGRSYRRVTVYGAGGNGGNAVNRAAKQMYGAGGDGGNGGGGGGGVLGLYEYQYYPDGPNKKTVYITKSLTGGAGGAGGSGGAGAPGCIILYYRRPVTE